MRYRTRFTASLDVQQSVANTREIMTDSGETFVVSDIQVFPVGKFASHHQQKEGFEITPEMIQKFVSNFYGGVGTTDGTLPVYVTHDDSTDRPAAGWVIDLIDRGMKGLWATVKWNKLGLEQIRNELYKYISPEWSWEYTDPRSGEKYENVLFAPALVNEPYFNSMSAVTASEKQEQIINLNIMDLQSILSKPVDTLTDEEKAFVREHVSELSDEQKSAFASVIEEKSEEKVEEDKPEPNEDDKKEDGNEGEKPSEGEGQAEEGGDKPVEGEVDAQQPVEQSAEGESKEDEVVTASEQRDVRMSAAEHSELVMQAREGMQAKQELRRMKMSAKIESIGHVPSVNAKALELAMSLDEEKAEQVVAMLASIPTGVKREKKSLSDADVRSFSSVDEEVMFKANEYKAKNKVTFGEAMNAILDQDKDLKKRYEAK